MNDLQQILGQYTPWGLTVAQTGLVILIAAGLLFGLGVLRFVLQLTGELFRIGCAVMLLFLCGLISFMVFYNFASR
ncbi:MAG: hypothetical protein ABI947_07565 [Chloroflexota bacterium]